MRLVWLQFNILKVAHNLHTSHTLFFVAGHRVLENFISTEAGTALCNRVAGSGIKPGKSCPPLFCLYQRGHISTDKNQNVGAMVVIRVTLTQTTKNEENKGSNF